MDKKIISVSPKEANLIVFRQDILSVITNDLPTHLKDILINEQSLIIDTIALIGKSSIELFLKKDDYRYHIGYLQIFEDKSFAYFPYKADYPI